jgi:hypothetical protein
MISKQNQNVANCARVFKYKKKQLVVSKKFGNGPEQKLLALNFLVLIENVCFDPEFCFKKEYIQSLLEQKHQYESFRS